MSDGFGPWPVARKTPRPRTRAIARVGLRQDLVVGPRIVPGAAVLQIHPARIAEVRASAGRRHR